ncbi:MAG: MarR family transcriptional regulator [Chloroflexi bacterium]|nr:MarR family transcriptional regulator [Chloroflexota bacterium]
MTRDDIERLAAFRLVLRRFLRFSEEAARAVGLTPQHYQTLLAIKGQPGRERVAVGELAAWLLVEHHSAVGLVDRLESAGLVARETDVADRRRVWVSLTPRGEAVLASLAAAHRDELSVQGPALVDALQAVLNNVEAVPAGGGTVETG